MNVTEEGVEAEVTLSKVSSLPKTYNNDVFKDNFGVSYKLDRSNSSNNFSFTLFSDGLFYLCEFRYLFLCSVNILSVQRFLTEPLIGREKYEIRISLFFKILSLA